jgi:hypothetical protein
MDNGLIFPYPRVRVPGEAGETNHPLCAYSFGSVCGVRGT